MKDYWFPNRSYNNLDRMKSISKIFDLGWDGKLIVTSIPNGASTINIINNGGLRMIFKVPVGVVNKPTMINRVFEFIKKIVEKIYT